MSKNSSVGFGLGVLFGVVGGIIAGVLYAPKPGNETREDLKKIAIDIAKENAPIVKEAKSEALNKIEIIKCKFETEYKKLCEKLKAKKLAKAKNKEENDYEFN